VTACVAPEGRVVGAKTRKYCYIPFCPYCLGLADCLLNPTEEKPIYLSYSAHRMKWSEREQISGEATQKILPSFALRIGAEILLSRRGKRLERKPDPLKGNAQIRPKHLVKNNIIRDSCY